MSDDDDGDCDGNHYDGCVVDGMVTTIMIVRNDGGGGGDDDDDNGDGNGHNPDNNHITLAVVIFSRPSAGARS